MKKKILIFLFILSISLCLAFISSASEYDFISCHDYRAIFETQSDGTIWAHYGIREVKYLKDGITHTLSMFVIEASGPDVEEARTIYSIQPYSFKMFVDAFTNKNGDCTYYEFLYSTYVYYDKMIELGLVPDSFYVDWMFSDDNNPSGSYSFLSEGYFNQLYFYNDELTYSEGYAQGITDFKQSTSYTETLALEREIGQAEGKDNYLLSDEYKSALKTEYDNGYDDGLNDLEESKNKTNFVAILGTCGIGVLVLAVVYFISARKKHKRK